MKLLISFVLLCTYVYVPAFAQFEKVYVGINGLTCSQCSRTVEMSIRKLHFVADVQMSLQHTEGIIILKKGEKADMEKVAQAVFDAGFSVRYLKADLNVDNTVSESGTCISYNGDEYVLARQPASPLKGTVQFTFLGKKYMPKNELKKVQQYMDIRCDNAAGKVYHVSI